MRDRFVVRLVLLGSAVFLAVALWRSWPDVAASAARLSRTTTQPRGP
jgi:hypothetical protein